MLYRSGQTPLTYNSVPPSGQFCTEANRANAGQAGRTKNSFITFISLCCGERCESVSTTAGLCACTCVCVCLLFCGSFVGPLCPLPRVYPCSRKTSRQALDERVRFAVLNTTTKKDSSQDSACSARRVWRKGESSFIHLPLTSNTTTDYYYYTLALWLLHYTPQQRLLCLSTSNSLS